MANTSNTSNMVTVNLTHEQLEFLKQLLELDTTGEGFEEDRAGVCAAQDAGMTDVQADLFVDGVKEALNDAFIPLALNSDSGPEI